MDRQIWIIEVDVACTLYIGRYKYGWCRCCVYSQKQRAHEQKHRDSVVMENAHSEKVRERVRDRAHPTHPLTSPPSISTPSSFSPPSLSPPSSFYPPLSNLHSSLTLCLPLPNPPPHTQRYAHRRSSARPDPPLQLPQRVLLFHIISSIDIDSDPD
jgi:hypothetical protein